MCFVTNLKMLRAKHSIKQKMLSDLLGITLTSYSSKENGRRPFSLDEAKKISDLFQLSIENIFFNELVHVKETYKIS